MTLYGRTTVLGGESGKNPRCTRVVGKSAARLDTRVRMQQQSALLIVTRILHAKIFYANIILSNHMLLLCQNRRNINGKPSLHRVLTE